MAKMVALGAMFAVSIALFAITRPKKKLSYFEILGPNAPVGGDGNSTPYPGKFRYEN